MGNLGIAGGGGILRDETGAWLLGFSRIIGITSSFMAELWAVRDGLSLCILRNSQVVEIEMDTKAILDVLANPNQTNTIISSIVDDCKLLITRIPQVQFKHCYREANRCVDGLARVGGQQDSDLIVYVCPPVEIQSFIDFDLSGLYSNRHCPETIVNL